MINRSSSWQAYQQPHVHGTPGRRRHAGCVYQKHFIVLVSFRLAVERRFILNGDDFSDLARHLLDCSCWQSQVGRSEEHTSELQSLMRISYAVFCLKKKHKTTLPL